MGLSSLSRTTACLISSKNSSVLLRYPAKRKATSVNYHRHDYLVVSLGKSNFEIAGSGIRYPMQMEDGEMQVIKGGASHRITNLSDSPLQLVEMEVMSRNSP
jgi:mannose-6-phosphate isomerase-like protein (cupin superfamily)